MATRRRIATGLALAGVVLALAPAGAGSPAPVAPPELAAGNPWPAPNADLSSTRNAPGSSIDAGNVGRLRVAWRFRFTSKPTPAGLYASTPLVLGDRVYVQDLNSNVFALDLGSGTPVWSHWYRAPSPGPNGLAAGYGLLFGATDTRAFALDPATGRQVWARKLISRAERFVDVAPLAANGLVYTSTIGYAPFGRGALYALDPQTGRTVWRFDTIRDPWPFPREAGGGGAWYPPSAGADGTIYVGNSNPTPWGGSRKRPNGGMYPGPVLYTDSLLALDGRTGGLSWYDQVTRHDVRDYDFQVSPILATLPVGGTPTDIVLGAGKAGIVVAWDRRTRTRLWATRVGRHANDLGRLPRKPVRVCPGLLGGVETPMALADGRLFVPVVDLCMRESAVAPADLGKVDVTRGRGELVALDAASGRTLWTRHFPSALFGCATVANDVVFAPTFDGHVYALAAADGRTLWSARTPAGINGCPAVAGDTLLVGAGSPYPGIHRPRPQVIAYRLPPGATTGAG